MAGATKPTSWTEIAPIIDYAIDFHTGSADRHNITQIRCNLERPGMNELAMAFGAPFVIHSPGIPKSIREMLTKMGERHCSLRHQNHLHREPRRCTFSYEQG